MLSLSPPPAPRRRVPRDPTPRFKPSLARQLDAIRGCPDLQIPEDHLARAVQAVVDRLDVSAIEAQYSALGRHGYHPRQVLCVWIYGALTGISKSIKLARLVRTDAAFRFLAGGHAISAPTLRRFRAGNCAFFADALNQTLRIAHEAGLLATDELAVDSVRLRANASNRAVRQLERSKKRLAELATVAVETLSEEERAKHTARVAKHQDGVERCVAAGRTNLVLTNELAGLMKFPDGASAPGHRVTVVASGVKSRLIVALLVDASSCDYGKLEAMSEAARGAMTRAGVHPDQRLRITADAGFCSEEDLVFAASRTKEYDVLVAERNASRTDTAPAIPTGLFGRERFLVDGDCATCPAGRLMNGPRPQGNGRVRWEGVDCETCSLKAQCTKASRRLLTVSQELERARNAMRARMNEPGARGQYGKRMATVEPVFSILESVMGYRRVACRKSDNVRAEIALHALAYNIARLLASRAVRLHFCIFVPARQL